jgi:hypothetical protein
MYGIAGSRACCCVVWSGIPGVVVAVVVVVVVSVVQFNERVLLPTTPRD